MRTLSTRRQPALVAHGLSFPAIRDIRAPENHFLQQVAQVARLYGWLAYHTHDSRGSEPGYPDLTLVRPPRLIFAELKSTHGQLSRSQARWLEQLAGVGGIETYVWRPDDLDLVVFTLARRP